MNSTTLFRLTRRAALLLAVAIFCGTSTARATLLGQVDLGDAGRTTQWAVFALGGGITVTDTSNQLLNGPTITGNIGASGGGSITLSGTTKVAGTGYIKTGGVLRKSGTATITGGTVQNSSNDILMNKVVADAIAAANTAKNLAENLPGGVTPTGWMSMATVNQSSDLSLSDTTGNAHVVLKLTDFVLTGGAEFTLEGTAQTTYIINVSGQFSLLGGKIKLINVLPENVLFNITGPGSDVSLTSGAEFNGFLYATERTVNLSGASKLTGTLIANKVNVSGASRILKPTYTSP